MPSILYVVATQLGGSLEVGIIRQFTFSSSVQCMSVVVRVLGADHMDVYVKGAPEKVASLCRPHTGKTPVVNVNCNVNVSIIAGNPHLLMR